MRGVRHCWLVLTAGTALLVAGCNTSTCDRATDSLVVHSCEGVTGTNSWFSAPYRDPKVPLGPTDSGYQYFPPARTITFEHNLGSVPIPVITLAFSNNGSLATSAGNESLIECMDDKIIQIKNDTCSNFNVWVQAQGSGIPSQRVCDGDSLVLPDAGVSDVCSAPGSGGSSGAADEPAGAGGAAP
ncbi:MAG TPA: hypothetical protein VIK01_18690 [Polyangiaceae bacterium]